jgi:hypothetical protein
MLYLEHMNLHLSVWLVKNLDYPYVKVSVIYVQMFICNLAYICA